MMIGLASLNQADIAGLLVYLVGHGLVKASLFMIAGIIEARCAGIDEIGLRGAGRSIWPVGIVMAVGALMLAGLPFGLMEAGSERIAGADHALRHAMADAMLVGAACTGAAVFRVAGRVFGGFGPVPGEEERAPTEQEQEKADRPLGLMLAPALLLLALAYLPVQGCQAFLDHAAAHVALARRRSGPRIRHGAGAGDVAPDPSGTAWSDPDVRTFCVGRAGDRHCAVSARARSYTACRHRNGGPRSPSLD